MLNVAISAAIDDARPETIDAVRQRMYDAWGEGLIDDDQAQRLDERIMARKGQLPSSQPPGQTPPRRLQSIFKPRRLQRSPDREASLRRRRYHAWQALPRDMAQGWTTGALAVLRVVGEEVLKQGRCDRTLGEIAARAGVGRTLARDTINRAAALGLLVKTLRPIPGRPSLTNELTIISDEWLAWLSAPAVGGSKKTIPTKDQYIGRGPKRPFQPFEGLMKGSGRRPNERRTHVDSDDGDVAKRNLRSLR